MNYLIKRDSYYGLTFALVLVFTLYGCQTASNTVTDESAVSNLQFTSIQADTKSSEIAAKDTELKEKGKSVTEKAAGEVPDKPSETQERSLEGFEENLLNKWSGFLGHGGVPGGSTARETAKANANKKETESSEAEEVKSFPELDKKLIGKWLNEKETESMEFFTDNTITIINEQGSHRGVRGTFRFTEKDRLAVNLKGGFLNLPVMAFKITVSENDLTLIGEKDNVPTTYKRVK